MWFLTATEKNAVIILDEPDVYMHADLQRKLIRLLFDQNYRQTVVATHSLEIISESEPQDILVIDRKKPKSKFSNSIPGVQEIIDRIGCVHNIQLTRLWACKKCLLVEGDDPSILKHLYRKISSDDEPFDRIPTMPINGWGGWNYAIGSSMILKNASNEKIVTYCLLDRDYHTQEEIQSRLEDSKERKVELHIWNKKELENYLLIPTAISRIINSESKREKDIVTDSEISKQLEIIAEKLKDQTFDSLSNELFLQDKGHGVQKANQKARNLVDSEWNSLENKLSLVSGKDVISKLSKWTQDNYKVSLSPERIAKELNVDEISKEMVAVLKSIEQNKSFGLL